MYCAFKTLPETRGREAAKDGRCSGGERGEGVCGWRIDVRQALGSPFFLRTRLGPRMPSWTRRFRISACLLS